MPLPEQGAGQREVCCFGHLPARCARSPGKLCRAGELLACGALRHWSWRTPMAHSAPTETPVPASFAMKKTPPSRGPQKPSMPGFNPQGGFRATVGLPASAAGGARPGVSVPGFGQGAGSGGPAMPAALSKEDINRLLKLGGAHLAAGRLEHAAQAAAAILKVEPQNPDAMHLIGLVALG